MAGKKKKTSKKRDEKFLTVQGEKVEVLDKVPEGWKADEHATTAPRGYKWVTNGKSRFGGQRKSALIKVAPTAADNPTAKATPTKPVKAAQKSASKPKETKPAAPKNEQIAAKKTVNAKKNAVDKLLKHNDKDEMKVGGEKPIVINGANVKPKRAPKVLRKVAKSGGYTAWDDIKRNGKTFATEQEANDYAADVLKKTGKIVLVSPTDRQVTHTFRPEEEKKTK